MTTYKQRKAVMKCYTTSGADLRFYRKLYLVSKNRELQEKNAKKLILFLSEQMERTPLEDFSENLPEKMFSLCFSQLKPEDRLLYLAEDCYIGAIIRYLYLHRKEERRDSYFKKALEIFQLSLGFDYEELYLKYSAVHRILTERNYLCYAISDDLSRRYLKDLVYQYAKKHRIRDSDAALAIEEDYPEKGRKIRLRCYMILLTLLLSSLSLFVLFFCGIFPFLFLLFPVATLSYQIVCTVASVLVKPAPILKLKNKKIEKPVLTVITTLLTNEGSVKEFEGRLRIMAHQNPEKLITFGLLADLKDSLSPENPEDEKLTALAVEAIERLNREEKGSFCLFIRKRQKSPTENRYMGYERKRGALIELVRWIKGKEHSFKTVVADEKRLRSTAYILTLDADTDLRIGSVSTLYSAMTHPHNKPVIQNGVVTSGYGVLQPRMITCTESASSSPFAVLYEGGGGIDSYQNVLFDFYQSVFGKGAFCGKGMFDVDVFDQVIDGAFPDGQILSHDLLEGTRLRCGYLSEYALTDSAPATALSYFKRLHRWLRGDLQAFPFSFPLFGKKDRNPIDGPSKFMIIANVVQALTPVLALLSLFLSTAFKEATCIVFLLLSFSYLLFPLACTVIRTARYVKRRFYSTVMQNIWRSLCSTLYSLSALCYNAQVALDALIRVLYRKLISGKKLLEWETAGEGEKRYKNKTGFRLFLLYHLKSLPALLVGILMMLFAGGGTVRLFGVAFLLFPAISYRLSIPYRKKRTVNEKQKERLIRYAKDSFGYYERFVTEEDHFLPPDNYQEMPVAVLARRTSPTNIALYLTSVMSACDLGIISEDTASERISNTLTELEKLPKYRGHLYNWYSTETEEVLGPAYISTVDSGNLALALLALSEGLKEWTDKNTEKEQQLISELLENTDFSFLYNEKKGLLCIGYDPISEKQSENCYDLLASEARSAYFYAISHGQIPVSAWEKLMRPITERDGYLGLYSWSGTMFEYFMPALFLPVYRNTLLFEALCFALFEQIKDKSEGMWGRSESCYFAFDPMMNYQYRAFGSTVLAMDPAMAKEDVLAPYASFLVLSLSPALAYDNLLKMEKAGLYGQYGFFDAMDFTPARVGNGSAIIRNYMAHHVGMSITAVDNACNDNIFISRIMRNIDIRSSVELLKERVPSDEPCANEIFFPKVRATADRGISLFGNSYGKAEKQHTDYALLYSGPYTVLASGRGEIFIKYKEQALSSPLNGSFSLMPCLKVKTSSSFLDLLSHQSRFFYDGKQIGYTAENEQARATLYILPTNYGILFRTVITEKNGGESKRSSPPELLFTSLLPFATEKEYLSHPAFAGLSVEGHFDKEQHLLIYKRRQYDKKRPELFFGISFGSDLPECCITKADDLPDFYKREELSRALFEDNRLSDDGPLRKPFIGFRIKKERSGSAVFDFYYTVADREKGLYDNIGRLSSEQTAEILSNRMKGKDPSGKRIPGYLYDKNTIDYVSLLLSAILKRRNTDLNLPCYDISRLWQYGISGDYPILSFFIPVFPLSDSEKRVITWLLKAYRHIIYGGIRFDLVFIGKEKEQYFSPAKKELSALADSVIGNDRQRKAGGVHLLFDTDADTILPSFSKVFITLTKDCYFDELKKQFSFFLPCDLSEDLPEKGEDCPEEPVDLTGFALGSGIFKEKGFTIFPSVKKHPPYSFIYASHQFGTLVTDRSLGFTWFRNSGELRLTPFSGEELSRSNEERLILQTGGKEYDLAQSCSGVNFGLDCACYKGSIGVLDYRIEAGIDSKLPVKMVVLKVTNRGPVPVEAHFRYDLQPCLNKFPDGQFVKSTRENTVFYKRTVSYGELPFGMYLHCSLNNATIEPGKECTAVFLLGTVHLKNDRCYYHVLEKFRTAENVFAAFRQYKKIRQAFISSFRIRTDFPAIDILFNRYLPYQILTSRLYARTGFYQPGGAYGFRDQLQDALSLLCYDPDIARIQLIRSAAHQFYEGDVQHWWHRVEVIRGMGDPGVRTECSDDLLFMPYVFAQYLKVTGDLSLADLRIPYLSSELPDERGERYERPQVTERKESMYDHCIRAIDLVIKRRGEGMLCKMGSCDWNDGLSAVRGESVWLTQFLYLTLRAFLPYARREEKERYSLLLPELKSAINHTFIKDRYARAYFENGEPLGTAGRSYCAIDLLPQSFSVFIEKSPESITAINSAYRFLWEEDTGIFRLFAPSYDSGKPNPGYLGGYCPGFRENGGQYTHAAVWGAMALLQAGETEKGFHVLSEINPITKSMKGDIYAIEPYAMAGDIYFAKGFRGRGGWSQYTGAAGWYQNAILTELLGYEEFPEYFTLHPRFCDSFRNFSLEINKRGTIYQVEAEQGETELILLDEKNSENRFFFDKQRHKLKMVIAK